VKYCPVEKEYFDTRRTRNNVIQKAVIENIIETKQTKNVQIFTNNSLKRELKLT
jgi:hypothetical protein